MARRETDLNGTGVRVTLIERDVDTPFFERRRPTRCTTTTSPAR